MAITLQKGQRINLEKDDGVRLQQFCVGCNWGAITTQKTVTKSGFLGFGKRIETIKSTEDVDLDLSCVLFNSDGKFCDYLYSPLYKKEFLAQFGLPQGKLFSFDNALHHTGDDTTGDQDGDDGLDNEIITVDLQKINQDINQIFFFLNNVGKEDFSQIPFASIRMFEGTPDRVKKVFATYNISAEPIYKDKSALVMGELYKHKDFWKFNAIGDAYPHPHLAATIQLIAKQYINVRR